MRSLLRSVAVPAVVVLLALAGTALAPPIPRPVMPPPRPITPPPHISPPSIRPTPGVRLPTHDFGPHHVTPNVVRSNVQASLRTSPAEALGILGRQGNVLLPHERVLLTRQAMNELGRRVETGADPWGALQSVRQAHAEAIGLGPQTSLQLRGMEARIQARALTEGLEGVARLSAREMWPEAGRTAQQWLVREQNATRLDHAQAAEVRQALQQVARGTRRAEALDRLEGALRGPPARAAETLGRIDPGELPASLQASVRGLRGLAELRAEAGRPWNQVVEVARLRNSLTMLEQGLAETGIADPALVKSIRQDLGVKAYLEGHVQAARELLALDGSADHAVHLLRDLKAMALGKGEVRTWPAEQAVAPDPAAGAAGTRGPPRGLLPLIPEAQAAGWRPPVRQGARSELPPIEQAARLEKPLAEHAEAGVKQQRPVVEKETHAAFHHVHRLHQGFHENEEREKKRLAGLEKRLHRELQPAERALAWHLGHQGKDDDAIAEALQREDDEAAFQVFVEQVEAELGRGLTPAEKEQLRKLWRRGHELVPSPSPVQDE